ncbi:MAG: exopolyphosphatase [Spirochaetaceae bacterium]|jgi:nanoRNase/pAp phosphatase (c-di-AMP/oligoRNAs hydrolase)|nr:exopolyphosphatase [Spirochaetaceae bacterium]
MRLITRSDFDGLACGALLESLGLVDEWLFVHPKDIQDGYIEATKNDIVANVPYIPGCGLWFDHHSSEDERLGANVKFEGASKKAPSCARVIYDYYGGEAKFKAFAEMIKYVDKMDSADLTEDEIMCPSGWVLLGFIADPRTGLGRFRSFSISNLDLMKKLAKETLSRPIGEILALPDVKERIDVYLIQNDLFIDMIKKHAKVYGEAVFVDLRNTDPIHAGNRFLLYTLFPEQNISVVVVEGKKKVNTVITVGHSIINKSSDVDVGSLMLKYGGGGHKAVGTCQVACADTDRVIGEIIEAVK